jgi:DNA-binding HxlR family transcriptional regulator
MVQNETDGCGVTVTGDGRNIPVAVMVEDIVGCKWSLGILRLLADRCNRPSALLRASPGLSTKVMNERLQKMMRFGIVTRIVIGEKPPVEVDYVLTHFGQCFMGIVKEVQRLQEAVDNGELLTNDADIDNSKQHVDKCDTGVASQHYTK